MPPLNCRQRQRSTQLRFLKVLSSIPETDKWFWWTGGAADTSRAKSSSVPTAMDTSPYCKVLLRSEEHTSELQSLMRISYAVFCLKNKKPKNMLRTSSYIKHQIK